MISDLSYRILYKKSRKLIARFFRGISCGIILIVIFIMFDNPLYAQVKATGHVFAEIVEPVAISPTAYNSHNLSSGGMGSHDEYVFAEIRIRGNQHMNVDVAVVFGNLLTASHEILSFDAYACPVCMDDDPKSIPEEKKYTLKGIPREITPENRNGIFSGGYRVVIMYN